MDSAKPFCISKREVFEAYKQVKKNRGSTSVYRRCRLKKRRYPLLI